MDQLYIFLPSVQASMITAYIIIFIVGVIGNMTVLLVVLSNSHMRTNTNIYLVNLSAADILMCLVSVPLTPMSTFMGRWVLGETLCKLFPSSQVQI